MGSDPLPADTFFTAPRFTLPIDTKSVTHWCEYAQALLTDQRPKEPHSEHGEWDGIRHAILQAEWFAKSLPEWSPERIWLSLARDYAPPCSFDPWSTCFPPDE
jgi:hypothetical protein